MQHIKSRKYEEHIFKLNRKEITNKTAISSKNIKNSSHKFQKNLKNSPSYCLKLT